MDSIDKFFQKSHYDINRTFLRIVGLWPFYSVTKRYAIYCGFLLLLISGLIFQVLGIIEIWSDPFEVVDNLPLLILSALSIFKVVCLIYSLPKVKYLLIQMVKYWHSPKSEGEAKILHFYAISGRKFNNVYAVMMLSHSALFLFSSPLTKFIFVGSNNKSNDSTNTLNVQLGIPYRVNYLVDLDTYYIPIFIHTAMCEVSYVIFLITSDILLMTFVQHCCGLLAAVKYLLKNAMEFADNIDGLMKTLTKESRTYSVIVYSIRRHSEAIQFINLLELMFTLPLFLHMGCIISIISIVEFQVASNIHNTTRIFSHIIYFNGAVVNAFFANWQGQKIIDYSERVYKYAYSTQWYDMPNATRKLLIMIMLRSRKQFQITAGKLIVMSYENFNAVMRLSLSYFMLLRSIQ